MKTLFIHSLAYGRKVMSTVGVCLLLACAAACYSQSPVFSVDESNAGSFTEIYYDPGLNCIVLSNNNTGGPTCGASGILTLDSNKDFRGAKPPLQNFAGVGGFFNNTTVIWQLPKTFQSSAYENIISVHGDFNNLSGTWLWSLLRDPTGQLWVAKQIDTANSQQSPSKIGYKVALWDPSSPSTPSFTPVADTLYVRFMPNGQVRIDEIVLKSDNTWAWNAGLLNFGVALKAYNTGTATNPPTAAPQFAVAQTNVAYITLYDLDALSKLGDTANKTYFSASAHRFGVYGSGALNFANDSNLVAQRAGMKQNFSSSWQPCNTGFFQVNDSYDIPPFRTTTYSDSVYRPVNTPCSVPPSPPPAVSLSTQSLAFQLQAGSSGYSSDPQLVTLTNSGSSDLSLSSIQIGGSDTGDFSETDNCVGTIGAGASCTIDVVFTDNNPNGGSANVQIFSNAASSPDTIQVSGRTD